MTSAQRLIEEGKQEGIMIGLTEGRKEGELKAKKELAKKLLLEGMNVQKVAELVELAEEEVKKLHSSQGLKL